MQQNEYVEQLENKLDFRIIIDEDDILFHKAYIMCCEIFPGMMPYYFFRQYYVSVALLNNKIVGFMLLDFKSDSSSIDNKKITSINEHDDSSKDSDLDELASKSTNSVNEHPTQKELITLVSIGVDKDMRGKKIGDEYIKWLKKHFQKKSIELHVSVKNTAAINLYLKHGFVVDTIEKLYYNDQGYEPYTGPGRDAYIMTFYCS